MQEVYVATDLHFSRKVALKAPKNPSAEKRFARSAQMSARVNHPNVAKTLDYLEEDGRGYLVEELVAGTNLSRRMESTFEILDPHLAAHVLHHLARGTASAHHAGVFHRDLKPSNIIVSEDAGLSLIKITDFGIAKMAEREISDAFKDENTLTGSSTAMGALPYMAPEMIERPKTAGLPADIWSVGAITYTTLAGTQPYGTGLSAVLKIAEAKPPLKPKPLRELLGFGPLSDDVWEIILACLKKDPTERPDADALVSMCSNLCYSQAKRETGTIENFRAGTGNWGFIRSDTGESVFFHAESFYGEGPRSGTRVNFAPFPAAPRPRAHPVLPIKG